MTFSFQELKEYLDEKADFYNQSAFTEEDPVQIPHRFSAQKDVEIAGFLAATISWGNRKAILKSADKMLQLLEQTPYDFVMNASEKELQNVEKYTIHRTFSGEDFAYFLRRFREVYQNVNSMEVLFETKTGEKNFYHAIERFRTAFLLPDKHRSHKHISSTYKNSSAKRLMMFLRWMVRQDNRGVDLGIWNTLNASFLSIPLDVHTGNSSRQLGLLQRRQNDWKSVAELDLAVRKFDEKDPAKYDFALFGIGVNKNILL